MTNEIFHFGLIGSGIEYSLTPEIFRLFFEYSHLTGKMELIDLEPTKLNNNIERLKSLNGFSITIPLKQTIIGYLDNIDPEAAMIGAVNSVAVIDSKLVGFNTDHEGFLYGLRQTGGPFRKSLIIGYGGAARAVIYGLSRLYPEGMIYLHGRDMSRAAHFCDMLRDSMPLLRLDLLENIGKCESDFDLIVNCTPLGGTKYPGQIPLPTGFRFDNRTICYDLVYRPTETEFLKLAAAQGCRTINGLEMLVAQAAESFTIWTEANIDTPDMIAFVIEHLKD